MLGSVVKGLLGAVVPPIDASHGAQYGWRMRVALVSFTALLGVILITMLAFGAFAGTTGFSGFAKASDLAGVVTEIRENRVNVLDNQLLELRIKHCRAQSQESRELYWAKIAAAMNEFAKLTGRTYTLPACSDL